MFEGDNLCGDDNGMCTHYCFPLPAYDSTSKSTKTGCMCPDFFILNQKNMTEVVLLPNTDRLQQVKKYDRACTTSTKFWPPSTS
jgi:hypothetical protein